MMPSALRMRAHDTLSLQGLSEANFSEYGYCSSWQNFLSYLAHLFLTQLRQTIHSQNTWLATSCNSVSGKTTIQPNSNSVLLITSKHARATHVLYYIIKIFVVNLFLAIFPKPVHT
jgi:hypothetical protein